MKILFLFLFFTQWIYSQSQLEEKLTNAIFEERDFEKVSCQLEIFEATSNRFFLNIDFSKVENNKVLPQFISGENEIGSYWTDEEYKVFQKRTSLKHFEMKINDTTDVKVSILLAIRSTRTIKMFVYTDSPDPILSGIPYHLSIYSKKGSLLKKCKEVRLQKLEISRGIPEILESDIKGTYIGKSINLFGNNFTIQGSDEPKIYIMDKNSIIKGTFEEALLQIQSTLSISELSETEKLNYKKAHNASQKLTFILPDLTHALSHRKLKNMEKYFGVQLGIIIYRNGYISLPYTITLLDKNWKRYAILFSFLIVSLLIGFIGLITRKFHYLPNLLIDTNTNSYSLSALQAFSWTIVLLFSYGYIAFCRAIIIQSGEIPEFPSSLLILMGISYSGLLGSTSIQKFFPQNTHKRKVARLRDIFSIKEGDINISRVQLFGFNLLVLIVYIVNILIIDPLSSLPEVPMTLQGLLIGSHAGYIGSKLLNDKVFVNFIHPVTIYTQTVGQRLIIIGGGFKEGIKVIIDGEEPQAAKFISPNQIECEVPLIQNPASKFITLVSRDGSMTESPSPIEIVDKPAEE